MGLVMFIGWYIFVFCIISRGRMIKKNRMKLRFIFSYDSGMEGVGVFFWKFVIYVIFGLCCF